MNQLILGLAIVASLVLSPDFSPQVPTTDSHSMQCPMHTQHTQSDARHSAVETHGDHAMGFPHDKTMHHFHLAASGGTIEVTANDSSDQSNITAIRSHLTQIADMFGGGDFSTPMFVHDAIPPGITSMKLLKEKIRFQYESISAGGVVRIMSSDPVALAAIHDFLRFQITDHQTGDPLEVSKAH